MVAEEAEAKWVASQQALLKLTAAYKSYFGAASVGTDFATRQITGVAAGSEDTDAVNVAQLKALNTKVDANKIEYVSINSSVEEIKEMMEQPQRIRLLLDRKQVLLMKVQLLLGVTLLQMVG
mgnify:FL=1